MSGILREPLNPELLRAVKVLCAATTPAATTPAAKGRYRQRRSLRQHLRAASPEGA
jgi:hypothetical protein